MKKEYIYYFVFFLYTTITFGQEKLASPPYEELFKVIPFIDDSTPEWALLMYSDNPNYYSIEHAYMAYYKVNAFHKTVHTQNFKYFVKFIRDNEYLKEDGWIKRPSLEFDNNKKERKTAQILGSWEAVGPLTTYSDTNTQKSVQSNIYTFDQSTSNPNLLYAGTETGGVYKSLDKGLNWIALGEDFLNGGSIGVVKIDPINEAIAYVGINTNTLYKTTDGGSTWTQILNESQLRLNSLQIDPSNNNLVYCAGNNGFKRSSDGGLTWTTILTDPCWDIRLKTDDPSTVFVMKSNPSKKISEFYKSTDSGQTFSLKDTGWFSPSAGVAMSNNGAKIGVTNADPNRLFVLLLGTDTSYAEDNNYIGIYRSDDAGETWHTPYDGDNDGQPDNEPGGPYSETHWCLTGFNVLSTGYDQGFYNAAIEVSDTDPDKFLVGCLNLFKSEDGGVSYTKWGGYNCTNCTPGYRHPDIQDIQINNGDVWVCSDGGVDYYDVDLNYIESRNSGINGTQYWGFDQGWNHDVLAGGRYHNGNAVYYQNYGDGNFKSIGGAESATGFVNKGENKKVYHSDLSSGKLISETLTGEIVNIPNLSKFPNQSSNFINRSEIVTDPISWNTLYLGLDNNLWKSEDSGSSFSIVNTFGTETSDIIKGIEISRENPNILFVTQKSGSIGKLWRSTNGGLTWEDILIPANNPTVYISMNIDMELYMGFNNGGTNINKVFKSTDLGDTWVNLSSSILNGQKIENIQCQEGTDGGVYLTSNSKIWYRNNTHSDWQEYTNGLPLNFKICKILPFYRDNKIRVAGSRGIWERELYETSQPKAQPTVSKRVINCNREEILFEDFSILDHSNASWLWDFPGASSVDDITKRNPLVTYDTPGIYDVTLTVANDVGSSSKTVSNMITIEESFCNPEPNPLMALEFGGNSNQGNVHNATIQEDNISNFSFTAWVKPNGVQSNFSAIFSLSQAADKIALNFREGNNTLGIHWNGSQSSWDSNLIVPADEWSFIAITVSPTEVVLYVNEKEAVRTFNSTPFDLNNIILGKFYNRSDRHFKGQIDEASFWKRTLSTDELHLARHLTKDDVSDPDLIAYYQFNHEQSESIFDKKGSNDLSKTGAVTLVDSDAPVGPGTSTLLEVTSGGSSLFGNSNISINFPSSGTYPDGKVVVSEINIDPSVVPATNSLTNSYWVINNYGLNENFSIIDNLLFTSIDNSEGISASDILLYQRDANNGATDNWTMLGNALQATSTELTFDTSISVSSFDTQLYLGTDQVLNTSMQEIEEKFVLFPNAVQEGVLYYKGLDSKALFVLYDGSGKELQRITIAPNENTIQIGSLAFGIYFYSIESSTRIHQGKLLVN